QVVEGARVLVGEADAAVGDPPLVRIRVQHELGAARAVDGELVADVERGGAEHRGIAARRRMKRRHRLAGLDERPFRLDADGVELLPLDAEAAARRNEVPLPVPTLEPEARAGGHGRVPDGTAVLDEVEVVLGETDQDEAARGVERLPVQRLVTRRREAQVEGEAGGPRDLRRRGGRLRRGEDRDRGGEEQPEAPPAPGPRAAARDRAHERRSFWRRRMRCMATTWAISPPRMNAIAE